MFLGSWFVYRHRTERKELTLLDRNKHVQNHFKGRYGAYPVWVEGCFLDHKHCNYTLMYLTSFHGPVQCSSASRRLHFPEAVLFQGRQVQSSGLSAANFIASMVMIFARELPSP